MERRTQRFANHMVTFEPAVVLVGRRSLVHYFATLGPLTAANRFTVDSNNNEDITR